jgi:hypothetical protein
MLIDNFFGSPQSLRVNPGGIHLLSQGFFLSVPSRYNIYKSDAIQPI